MSWELGIGLQFPNNEFRISLWMINASGLDLTLVRGIGAVRLRALIEHFGDAASAWQGAPDELRTAGLSEKIIERLIEARKSVDLNQLWDKIIAQGIKILNWDDELYPPRLKKLNNRRRFYMCAVNCYLKIILQLQLWARAKSHRMVVK